MMVLPLQQCQKKRNRINPSKRKISHVLCARKLGTTPTSVKKNCQKMSGGKKGTILLINKEDSLMKNLYKMICTYQIRTERSTRALFRKTSGRARKF